MPPKIQDRYASAKVIESATENPNIRKKDLGHKSTSSQPHLEDNHNNIILFNQHQ